MNIISATFGERRRLSGVALLTLGLLVATASAADAQDTVAQITTPEPQSEVPVDEPFTVGGTACEPGSTVTVAVEAANVDATTTADDDGAFSTTLTMPSDHFDFAAERFDINEFVITGACGDATLESGVLVPERPESSQVEQVPSGGVQTGGGGTAEPPRHAPALVALVCTGGALAMAARRRRVASR